MNSCGEDSFFPVQRIGLALRKARKLFAAEMEAALADADISSSQACTLLLLSFDMAHSSAGLARLLGVNAGFVTRIVDGLEKRELVQRQRDNRDRRIVNLTLTETGREVAARTAEIMPGVLNRRLAGFTSWEFTALYRLLGKLLEK